MKVKITYTIDVDESFRICLASYQQGEGWTGELATREDIKNHFQMYGDSLNEDIRDEYEQMRDRQRNNT